MMEPLQQLLPKKQINLMMFGKTINLFQVMGMLILLDLEHVIGIVMVS